MGNIRDKLLKTEYTAVVCVTCLAFGWHSHDRDSIMKHETSLVPYILDNKAQSTLNFESVLFSVKIEATVVQLFET